MKGKQLGSDGSSSQDDKRELPAGLPLSLSELILVLLAFSAITLVLTYPQGFEITSAIGGHYDSLFSVWRLAWIAHQLPRSPSHLFDANIFYPQPGTLSYSDAILLPGLVAAPLIWIGFSPVTVHNVLALASFVACGVCMYLLVRFETGCRTAAAFAGAVFAFQPFRFAHFSQLELLWGWPIPLAFLALAQLFRRARVRDGVSLGILVALQALSCLYYAVFLATGLAILTVGRLIGRPRAVWRAVVRPLLAAVLVCAALISPYSMPYRAKTRAAAARTVDDVRLWSPPLRSYLTTPAKHWLFGEHLTWSFGDIEHVLFPGLVATAAAIYGALDRRRRVLVYAALLAATVDMSLGFNGLTYRVLFDVMEPFHNLRAPGRMFVMVSAALAVLGGFGVSRMMRGQASGRRRALLGATLTAAVLLESASFPMPLVPVPAPPSALYHWLSLQPAAAVMEWPLPEASALGVTETPRFMYFSTFHWQPLVNGYSGTYPPSYIELLETMHDFPDARTIQYLRHTGVRYVILHSRTAPERYLEIKRRLGARHELRQIIADKEEDGEATVYELERS
jgi:hypothetical protein